MKSKDMTSKAIKDTIVDIDRKTLDMDVLRKFDLNYKFGPAYGLNALIVIFIANISSSFSLSRL